ncbi:MAG: SPOR domain-containing protein [Bacteroidota bacterium]
MAKNSKGRIAGIVTITVLLIAVGIGAWYWFSYKPKKEAEEQARLEQIAKEEAEKERIAKAAEKKLKYDKLIVEADSAFNQENWESARIGYQEAGTLFPKEQYPKEQLVLVQTKLDEIAARNQRLSEGVVESITSPIGQYFVIVSSSIDDDLAMDYAQKLLMEGTEVQIVAHNFNDLPFFGVSVGAYSSREEAASVASGLTQYPLSPWVLKF